MIRTAEIIRALTLPPAVFVRSLFKRPERVLRGSDPRHSDVPVLLGAEIAAVYHSQRVAGDFYEFLRVGPSRVLFGLFDLAGRREDTRAILVAAQNTFRSLAPGLFAGEDFNEAEAMVGLCHAVNCTILQFAAGFAVVPRSSAVTTRTWARSVIPTPVTLRDCCVTIPASPNWRPADCRWASSRMRPTAPPPAP